MIKGLVAITGASSGIGASLAELYASSGATLGLIGRDPDKLEQVAARCRSKGARVELLLCDVRETDRLQDWLRALEGIAPIDLLIASAGISGSIRGDGGLESREQVQQLVATNLLGVVDTIDAVVPGMIARKRGQIAVVSSLAGYRGLPYSPGYSASKAGVRAYGEALRAYLRPYGVRVSVVSPGFVDTPMTDRFKGSHPFLVSLPQATRLIKRGLDAERARIVFPRALAIELRLADLIPAWLGDLILRRVHFEIVPSPGMAAKAATQ